MKYVIIKRKKASVLIAYPVLFSESLNHCDMIPDGFEAISAGFCEIVRDRILVDMDSGSESLKLKSLEQDSQLIATWITTGESMLVMASSIYELPPKKAKKLAK